jgi:hypothetical protein
MTGTGTCIDAGGTCPGGASVGCLDAGSCATGEICCLNAIGLTSACSQPAACMPGTSVVLCGSSAECPSTAPNCCQFQGVGVCLARRCPRRGN